eukprot:15367027-Ditylum_brightwellii.AAC.1
MEPSTNRTSENNNSERQICSPMEKWLKRVKLCTKNDFPFLDMNMMWDDQGFLHFKVYHKEGQATKYVDHSSCHRPCTFKFIASGVYLQLGMLTPKMVENGEKQLDEIYPEHVEVLLAADLEPIKYPTLDTIWKKEVLSRRGTKKKCRNNQRTFFVIDYSSFLQKAKILDLICKLKKTYDLP